MKLRANKAVIMLVGLSGLIPLVVWLVAIFQIRGDVSWNTRFSLILFYNRYLTYALICLAGWILLRTQAIGFMPVVAALASAAGAIIEMVQLINSIYSTSNGVSFQQIIYNALYMYAHAPLLLLAALVFAVQWQLAKRFDSDSLESWNNLPPAPKAAVPLLGIAAVAGLGGGIFSIVGLQLSMTNFSVVMLPPLLIGAVCFIGCVAVWRGYRRETISAWSAAVIGLMGSINFIMHVTKIPNMYFLLYAYAPPLLAAGIILLTRQRGKEPKTQEVSPCD